MYCCVFHRTVELSNCELPTSRLLAGAPFGLDIALESSFLRAQGFTLFSWVSVIIGWMLLGAQSAPRRASSPQRRPACRVSCIWMWAQACRRKPTRSSLSCRYILPAVPGRVDSWLQCEGGYPEVPDLQPCSGYKSRRLARQHGHTKRNKSNAHNAERGAAAHGTRHAAPRSLSSCGAPSGVCVRPLLFEAGSHSGGYSSALGSRPAFR